MKCSSSAIWKWIINCINYWLHFRHLFLSILDGSVWKISVPRVFQVLQVLTDFILEKQTAIYVNNHHWCCQKQPLNIGVLSSFQQRIQNFPNSVVLLCDHPASKASVTHNPQIHFHQSPGEFLITPQILLPKFFFSGNFQRCVIFNWGDLHAKSLSVYAKGEVPGGWLGAQWTLSWPSCYFNFVVPI